MTNAIPIFIGAFILGVVVLALWIDHGLDDAIERCWEDDEEEEGTRD